MSEKIINFFGNIFNSIKYSYIFQDIALPSLNLSGIIEITILIFAIYKILVSLRNTRAWLLLKGILILAVFYVIAYICSFNVIMTIFKSGLSILIIALVIVFQGELKKLLENIGKKNIIDCLKKSKVDNAEKYISDASINAIVSACDSMSKVKTGALIVLEKDIPLDEYIKTGITIDSAISSQLVEQIFEHNTPLHDGAMIIRDDRIVSATCYLPLSDNSEIDKDLGTRHRAAIGLSEVTDALIIIVSEETGNISIAKNGKISRAISSSGLYDILREYQIKEIHTVNLKKNRKNYLNNWQLKLISFLFGSILWISMMNYIDPIISKTITNIPVTIINEDVIENDYQTYNIVEGETADIIIKGKQSEISNITKDDIVATADLSKLSLVNSVNIQVSIEKYDDITIINNENVLTIDIEELSTKDCVITVEQIGEISDGYYISKITPYPNTITITGPVTKLNKISKVVVDANCAAAYNGFKEQLSPIVYDKNGDKMDTSNLKFSTNNITVTYEVFKTKEVPLTVTLNNNKFTDGEITKYTSYPDKILIAADDNILAETTELAISVNVDITDDTTEGNIVKLFNLEDYIANNILIVNEEDKEVNMNITYSKYIEKSIVINKSDIKIVGLKDDLKYKINSDNINVKIKGLPNEIKNITAALLSPSINLSNAKPGTFNTTLTLSGTNINVVSCDDVSVTVEEK